MTKRENRQGIKSRGRILLLICVVCVMGAYSGSGLATLVIFKNDQPQDLPPLSFLTDQGAEGDLDVEIFSLPDASNEAIAYSASSTNRNEIFHHIYGYALPDRNVSYAIINELQKSSAETLSKAGARDLTGKDFAIDKNIKIPQAFRLDGELLLAFGSMAGDLRGLTASLEIIVAQDRLNRDGTPKLKRDGTIKTKQIFRGVVELTGTKKGKIRIKTKGKIKKRHISTITPEGGGVFRIDFDAVIVPYKTKARVGQEYRLSTFINSQLTTLGEGTGAEINFFPELTRVPNFQESGQIPEPATVIFLAVGGILLMMFPSRIRKISKV